jgi:flagellar basal body-associated protein FliL
LQSGRTCADAARVGRSSGARVTTLWISIAVGVLTFALGSFGMFLQKRLPEQHMASGSRDMIGAIMGLVTLLLALVLGTLVGSAYGFFAVQKANVETLGARAIQLDMALAQYGPEAQPLREGLKDAVTSAYQAIWGGGNNPKLLEVASYLPTLKQLNIGISSLTPHTPAQTQLVSTIAINAGIIEQTRLLMSLQLASSVSWPLLVIVVSWAMLLFCGFGVLSKFNATSVAVLALGAFRVPGASVEETIAAIAG